jgi:hypothetical protein
MSATLPILVLLMKVRWKVDQYGQVIRAASVVYPRRDDINNIIYPEQQKCYVTLMKRTLYTWIKRMNS